MRLGRTDWWWVLVLAVGFLAFMVGLPLAVVSDTFFVLNGGRFIAEHGLPHHDALTRNEHELEPPSPKSVKF